MSEGTRSRPRLTHVLVGASALLFLVVMVVQALGLYQYVPVLSGSMSGFVEAGDVSVLRPIDANDLAEGDVIAFYPPIADSHLTLHRVVEVVEPGSDPVVRTKGDANNALDPWTAKLQGPKLWRATSKVPMLGHLVLWLQGPSVRTVALALIFAIIVVIGLRRVWSPAAERDDATNPTGESTQPISFMGVFLMVVALGAVGAAGALKPGSASFTDAADAQHTVSTVFVVPPSDLTANLVCDLGLATAVHLEWTPSTSGNVIAQEIWRRPVGAAPVLVATVGADVAVHDDDLLDSLVGGSTTYAVRAVADGWASEFTNDASLLNLCDAPDPLPPALPADPLPSPSPDPVPTGEPLPVEVPTDEPLPVEVPTDEPLPVEVPTDEPLPVEVPTAAPTEVPLPVEPLSVG